MGENYEVTLFQEKSQKISKNSEWESLIIFFKFSIHTINYNILRLH